MVTNALDAVLELHEGTVGHDVDHLAQVLGPGRVAALLGLDSALMCQSI